MLQSDSCLYPTLKRCLQSSALTATLFAGVSLATPALAQGPCTGPGAPSTTETKCLTAVQIPGNPLRSFDISWVNPNRSTSTISAIARTRGSMSSTPQPTPVRVRLIGFVGIVLERHRGREQRTNRDPTALRRTADGSMAGTATAHSKCSTSLPCLLPRMVYPVSRRPRLFRPAARPGLTRWR